MKKNKAIEITVAILCAIGLWFYVVTMVTPNDDMPISNIPVVFQGETELRNSHDLIISQKSVDFVEVKFHGSRADLRQLEAYRSDLKAVVNVSNFTAEREYSTSYEIVFPTAVQDKELAVVDRSPKTVQFSVEKLATRQVEVRGVFDGTLAPGFVQGDMIFGQDMIKVVGPAAIMEQVDYAQVVVGGNAVSQTVTTETGITLIGKDGQPLHSNDLAPEVQQLQVTVPVLMEKTVPVTVAPVYNGGTSEETASIAVTPQTVTLRGAQEIMNELTEISLGELDLSLVRSGDIKELDIILPEGVSSASALPKAQVAVTFTGIETLDVTVAELMTVNVPEGMSASITETSLAVTIRGPSEDLIEIDDEALAVVADLSEYSEPGSFTVPVRVDVPVETVGAVGEYTVTVTLKNTAE